MAKKIKKVIKSPRNAVVDVQPIKIKQAKEERKSKYQIDADEFQPFGDRNHEAEEQEGFMTERQK